MMTWISGSMITVLVATMIPATGMTAMSVEQQDYIFKMGITLDIPISTFVIGEITSVKQLRPPSEIPTIEKNKTHLAIRKRESIVTGEKQNENVQSVIPPVFFDLSSSTLPKEAEEKILDALAKKADITTNLIITGYTCDLGAQKVNDVLALQRATVVADLLQTHGYRFVTVTGKGKQSYVSRDPEMRHLNRRVEFGILSQPASPGEMKQQIFAK